MEQDFSPAVVQSATMIASFYRHKAMRWRQIPPQVVAAAEIITGQAQDGPDARSTPEQTPAARQTRSSTLDQARNWPTEWELDRSVLNLAVSRFLKATVKGERSCFPKRRRWYIKTPKAPTVSNGMQKHFPNGRGPAPQSLKTRRNGKR
ncbi:hypothetical protein KEM52_002674 [Ascosphaera acerosa]|nr:hypothetical protein KEM52_002674 [Ascosphaera acerosa]